VGSWVFQCLPFSLHLNLAGTIQYEEFELMMAKTDAAGPKDQREELKGYFKFFDQDGNGTVDAAEFSKVGLKRNP